MPVWQSVCMYHSTGGGGREEEDELFNKGSLRDITVANNWDGLIAEWTHTMRWLQRKRTLSTSATCGCTKSVNPKPGSHHCGCALKSLNKQSSGFREGRRDSSVTHATGECGIVPASQPAAAVCACMEAESSAAWFQPPSLWTCWDQNLTPADRQTSRCSRWGEFIAGRCCVGSIHTDYLPVNTLTLYV